MCSFLPPAKEVCEGYVFTGVSVHTGGVRGFIRRGVGIRAFIWGGMRGFIQGGVPGFIWGACGFIWGACMVLFGGVCVVLLRGVCGFIRGVCGFIRGACMVLFGGHAWFYSGGMHGFFSFFGYNEIQSMSGRYASYWNAFLFKI